MGVKMRAAWIVAFCGMSACQWVSEETFQTRMDRDNDGSLSSAEFRENLGLLGEGGMGEVRKVRDHQLNRTVAMMLVILCNTM